MRAKETWLLPLLLLISLALGGCRGNSEQTFAGFTFGGGGKTFSCEPAAWTSEKSRVQLTAGTAGSPTTIDLVTAGPVIMGEPATLSGGTITVPEHQGQSSLMSGTLVQQSRIGPLVHGSFDLKARTADGREFPVVGSFTARSPDE